MWDERYSSDEYVYGTEPNDFLVETVGQIPKGKVLCLAEGEGRNSVYLAQQGFDVTAVDSSSVGLAKARRLAEQRNVHVNTIEADLAHFDIESERWHGVVSIFCHLPPEIRSALHRKVVNGLRPGGVLVLEAYTPRQLEFKTGGPPIPELTMTLQSLQQELDGLDLIHAKELDRDVHEGQFHHGRGAVVQVVAIKPK